MDFSADGVLSQLSAITDLVNNVAPSKQGIEVKNALNNVQAITKSFRDTTRPILNNITSLTNANVPMQQAQMNTNGVPAIDTQGIIIRLETANQYLKIISDAVTSTSTMSNSQAIKESNKFFTMIAKSATGRIIMESMSKQMITNYGKMMYTLAPALQKQMITMNQIILYKSLGQLPIFKDFFKNMDISIQSILQHAVPFNEESRIALTTLIPKRLEGIGKLLLDIRTMMNFHFNRTYQREDDFLNLERMNSESIQDLNKTLSQTSEQVIESIISLKGAMFHFLPQLGGYISKGIGLYLRLKFVSLLAGSISTALGKTFNTGFFSGVFNAFSDKFSGLIDKVVDLSGTIMNKMTDIYNAHFSVGVNKFFGALRADLIDKGKNFLFKLIPTVGNVLLAGFAAKKLFDVGNKFMQKRMAAMRESFLGPFTLNRKDMETMKREGIGGVRMKIRKFYGSTLTSLFNSVEDGLKIVGIHRTGSRSGANTFAAAARRNFMRKFHAKDIDTVVINKVSSVLNSIGGHTPRAIPKAIWTSVYMIRGVAKFLGSMLAFASKIFTGVILLEMAIAFIQKGISFAVDLALRNGMQNKKFKSDAELVSELVKNAVMFLVKKSISGIVWGVKNSPAIMSGVWDGTKMLFRYALAGVTDILFSTIRLFLYGSWDKAVARYERKVMSAMGVLDEFNDIRKMFGAEMAQASPSLRDRFKEESNKKQEEEENEKSEQSETLFDIKNILGSAEKALKGMHDVINPKKFGTGIGNIFGNITKTLAFILESGGFMKQSQDFLKDATEFAKLKLANSEEGTFGNALWSGMSDSLKQATSALVSSESELNQTVKSTNELLKQYLAGRQELNDIIGFENNPNQQAILRTFKSNVLKGKADDLQQDIYGVENYGMPAGYTKNALLSEVIPGTRKTFSDFITEVNPPHPMLNKMMKNQEDLAKIRGVVWYFVPNYLKPFGGPGKAYTNLIHFARGHKDSIYSLLTSPGEMIQFLDNADSKYVKNPKNILPSKAGIFNTDGWGPGDPVGGDLNIWDAIKQMMKNHEGGARLKAYRDAWGYSIGYGHFLGRSPSPSSITLDQAEAYFNNDFNVAYNELKSKYPYFSRLDPVRQGALVDLRFNTGPGGFGTFTKMHAALNAGNWAEAKNQLLDSKYVRDVPKDRSNRIASMLLTGDAKYISGKAQNYSTSNYNATNLKVSDEEILKYINPTCGLTSVKNLHPVLLYKLVQYAKLASSRIPGGRLTVTSGWRSHEQQEKLYKTSKPGYAAKPGYSKHEYGLAVDIGKNQTFDDLLAKSGLGWLNIPKTPEPWHLEPSEWINIRNTQKSIEIANGLTNGNYVFNPGSPGSNPTNNNPNSPFSFENFGEVLSDILVNLGTGKSAQNGIGPELSPSLPIMGDPVFLTNTATPRSVKNYLSYAGDSQFRLLLDELMLGAALGDNSVVEQKRMESIKSAMAFGLGAVQLSNQNKEPTLINSVNAPTIVANNNSTTQAPQQMRNDQQSNNLDMGLQALFGF